MALKEFTSAEWQEAAVKARRFQERHGMLEWETYRNYYRGLFRQNGSQNARSYYHNIFYTHYHTQVPSFYYRDPRIIITPRKGFGFPDPGRIMRARILESIDNILIKSMDFKGMIGKASFDTIFCGTGLAKFGFTSEFTTPKDAEDFEQSRKKGKKTEYNQRIKNNMPWGVRIAPEMTLFPYGTVDIKNCPWMIHVILRRTEDVKNCTYYQNTKHLHGTHTSLLTDKVRSLQAVDQDVDWTEIHEVWNFQTGKVGAYIPGGSKTQTDASWIRTMEHSKLMEIFDGFPCEILQFNVDPDSIWVVSDSRQIDPMQREINETKELIVQHRRLGKLKFLYQDGVIDSGELDKLLTEQAGIGVKVKGSPTEAISILQPHIPQDMQYWSESVLADYRHVTGVSKVGSGTESSGRKTASEIKAMTASQDIRISTRRDAVAEFTVRGIKKTNKLIQHFWSMEDVVPVVGVEGAIYWVKFKNTDLEGDFDARVDVDSMNPITLEGRKAEMMSLLQAVGSDPNINRGALLSNLMSQFDWADLPTMLPNATPNGPVSADAFAGRQASLDSGTVESGQLQAAHQLGANLPQRGV